jgi:ADP-ribosylglycohydrolase
VARGEFQPADYAQRISDLFAEDRVVGRGRATAAAARRLAAGVPWRLAGERPPSAGNGAAMRAGPVGLIAGNDPDRLIHIATEQSLITHQDPRCAAGAVAVAGAVSLALRPGPIDVEAFVVPIAEWAERVEPTLADVLRRLPRWLEVEPTEAAAAIASIAGDDAFSEGWQGISPFVTPSVTWSLYSFLKTPDDYWTTVLTAIAVGGDVDTTAAMAGAISGARVGLAGLPADLAARVNDRSTWGFEDLVALAEDAHALVTGAGSPDARH